MQPANPPRVGYVVKRYPRYSETFIVNEILAHEAAGVDVEIFSIRPPIDGHFQDRLARVRAMVNYLPCDHVRAADFWSAAERAGAAIPEMWARLPTCAGHAGLDVFQALRLAQLARAKGITHLHAHFASAATTVARLASRLSGIPYSFTAHAKDIFHEEVNAEELRSKLIDARAVIAVSQYNREYLIECFGVAANGVYSVYNGLPLDDFPYEAPLDRPPRIVAVGRLVEKKGFRYLIDACAILAARRRQFDCQIIGAGELEDALRVQIAERGLETMVTLAGPRPQTEVIAELRRAAALAAPCVIGEDGNRDGLPTVLLEAMALGVPCVATDVTGIPELVRHDETGLIVGQHDPVELANSMERLIDDRALRERLAMAARRVIETHFDIHVNAARIRQAIGIASPVPARDCRTLQEVG